MSDKQEYGEFGLQMKYFVLKPRGDDEYAAASRRAMRAYADSIRRTNEQFAAELEAWAHAEAQRAWKA